MIEEDKAKRERNHLAWLDDKENCGENPMKASKRQTNRNQNRVANPDPSSLPPSAGFTLIELLVVIAIIGILAGLTVTLSEKASSAKKRKTTEVLLGKLVTAIGSYKNTKDFGSYPYSNPSPLNPDQNGRVGGTTKILLPAMNPLFYELTGTIFNQQTRSYTSTQGGDKLNPTQCRFFFGKKGFENMTTNPGKTKSFIDLKAGEFAPISVNPTVNLLLAPVKWPSNTDAALERYRPIQSDETINQIKIRTLNPWQYRAPGIKNNKSFDLWADVPIGNKVHRINNWGESEVFDRNN